MGMIADRKWDLFCKRCGQGHFQDGHTWHVALSREYVICDNCPGEVERIQRELELLQGAADYLFDQIQAKLDDEPNADLDAVRSSLDRLADCWIDMTRLVKAALEVER